MKKLFQTKEEIDSGLMNLKLLSDHPGWKLYVEIAEINIDILKNEILKNPNGLSEIELNRLRDKLIVTEEMISNPQDMIKRLSSNDDDNDVENDPYYTVDTLPKRSADVKIDKDLEKN